MKTLVLTITTYVVLILVMILVNEHQSSSVKKHNYHYKTISTIHPGKKSVDFCSWTCHNNTSYCKVNHVKYLRDNNYTDILYFGVINLLKGTGDYGLANVIFLVILIPFFCLFLLIKGLQLHFKIKKLK